MTTTYGTIPISTGGRGSSGSGSGGTNLEYISRAKAKLKEGLGIRRPWPEMFNIHSISLPRPFSEAIGRIKTNVAYFRMNYAIVVLFILFLSLLWHPISLIVFIALMAAWIVLYFLRDEPLVIFSHLIDDRMLLASLAIGTIVLLLLTNATANIISSVGVGIVVVLIHAALRQTDDLNWDEEEEATGGLLASSSASYR